MRRPLLAQIAIATYRHGADDAGDAGGAISSVGATEHALGSLRVAPGGPSDVQLDDIDTRSPIAGLYVRLERLLAKQVCLRQCAACVLLPLVVPKCRCGIHTWRRVKPPEELAQLNRSA